MACVHTKTPPHTQTCMQCLFSMACVPRWFTILDDWLFTYLKTFIRMLWSRKYSAWYFHESKIFVSVYETRFLWSNFILSSHLKFESLLGYVHHKFSKVLKMRNFHFIWITIEWQNKNISEPWWAWYGLMSKKFENKYNILLVK